MKESNLKQERAWSHLTSNSRLEPITFLHQRPISYFILVETQLHCGRTRSSSSSSRKMDDFSFPTIAATDPDSLHHLPFPHFAMSPLWFDHHHQQSFSEAEAISKPATKESEEANMDSPPLSDDEGDELKGNSDTDSPPLSEDDSGDQFLDDKETMDMLWENFNEELHLASYYGKKGAKKGMSPETSASARESDVNKVEHSCVQTLSVPRSGSRLLHYRRPSLVMFLRVLKKLFLIQKISSSKRASSLYQK